MTVLSITNEESNILMEALIHYRDDVAKRKTRDREGRNPGTYYRERIEHCSNLIQKLYTADYCDEEETA